jgi:hypothetical protein
MHFGLTGLTDPMRRHSGPGADPGCTRPYARTSNASPVFIRIKKASGNGCAGKAARHSDAGGGFARQTALKIERPPGGDLSTYIKPQPMKN